MIGNILLWVVRSVTNWSFIGENVEDDFFGVVFVQFVKGDGLVGTVGYYYVDGRSK